MPEQTLTITEDFSIPEGRAILARNGKPVWIGAIGEDIEDEDFDEMILNPADAADLRSAP